MDIRLIAGGVIVFAAGVGAGYLGTRKFLEKSYAQMADDEIQEARKFYNHVRKEKYDTPGDAVEDLHGVEAAAEALEDYQSNATLGEVTVPKDEVVHPTGEAKGMSLMAKIEDEVTSQNIFADSYQLQQLDVGSRRPSHPYVITLDEFQENAPQHRQVVLTYYSGDNIVADEDDHQMDLVHKILGNENLTKWGIGSEDATVVLIRNEAYGNDYEVTYSEGHFAREVLGHEAELEHSDGHRRRRRPRWDDE